MNKILFFTLSVLVLNVNAQHDPAAKEILDRLSAKTKTYQSIKADFTNTLVNEVEDFSETFNGTIYLKGEKYKLEFMETETYCDGATKWVYLTESQEVNVSEIEAFDDENVENELFNNPSGMLTIYEKGFKYLYLEDQLVDGIMVSIIDLVPENLDKNYSRIRLFINKEKDQIYRMRYFGKDGNHYILTITSFETENNFPDSYFTFSPEEHPDVEIIDLRN